MRLPAAAVLRSVSWACPGRTDAKNKNKSSKDNPRVQGWMTTTVSQFICFRSKTDLVYRHEWLCRSGNGHGGSILTPQAENKICKSVGTCSTWKMQSSWLENTSVAFVMWTILVYRHGRLLCRNSFFFVQRQTSCTCMNGRVAAATATVAAN